jgi:hypothetical protein
MEAIKLPNGHLLAPYRAETGPAIGDAMLEIGPDHPDFSSWSRHVAAPEPAAAPASGLETVAEARGRLGKAEFVESDHPRAADGKFGSGGAKESEGKSIESQFSEASRFGGKQADWDKWKEHDDALSSMSSQEKNDFREYTAVQYRAINEVLRGQSSGDSVYDQKTKDMADRISDRLDKITTPEDWVVFRGGVIPENSLTPGSDFTDNGFVSTSRIKKVAEHFTPESIPAGYKKAIFEILVPKGTHAAYVREYSNTPGDYEMMIQRGTRFSVVSTKEIDGVIHAKLAVNNG